MHSTARFRPILHDDWSIRLGENRADQSAKTFVGYALLCCSCCLDVLSGTSYK